MSAFTDTQETRAQQLITLRAQLFQDLGVPLLDRALETAIREIRRITLMAQIGAP